MNAVCRLLAVFGLIFSVVMASAQTGTETIAQKKAILAALAKNQKTAADKFQKKPKDAKLKSEYIKTTLLLANRTMMASWLSSKEKYPNSLRLYRAVLKVDPKNEEAASNRKLIEDIYRSMNKPIPN